MVDYYLYIPHGSDETCSMQLSNVGGVKLYIPHGSDETEVPNNVKSITEYFISHMVQMKRLTYPFLFFDSLVFISHMVQMKLNNDILVNVFIIALYPTWFRWNAASLR